MYDFEDKGGRRVAVRPEITRRAHAGLRRAPPAVPWKAWTAGPQLPLREPRRRAATGSTTRSTSRSSARRRSRRRRRGHRPGSTASTAPSASRSVRLLVNSPGRRRDDRAAYVDALRAYLRAQRRRPLASRAARRSRSTRCGCSTRSGPRTAGRRRRAADRRVPRAGRRPPTSSGCRRARGPRHRVRGRAPARAGLDYYTPHALRVPGARARLGAERHRRRRSLRRPGRAARRPAHAWRRLRRRRSSGSCWPATPRACSRPPDGAGRRLRRRHDRRAARRWRSPPSCGRPASPPTGAFDQPQDEGQMKAADRSGAAVAVIIGRDELAAGAVTRARPAGRRAAGERRQDGGAPPRSSSTRPGVAGVMSTTDPRHAHRLVRDAARRATPAARRALRLGGAAARARRAPRVHRPARPHRPRPVRRRRRAPTCRSEYVVRITGTVRRRPGGHRQRQPAHR